jgi:hypothetical protein
MVTINLEDNEINAWHQVCDRALRNSGMEIFDAVAHFRMKVIQAQQQAQRATVGAIKGNGVHIDGAQEQTDLRT